MSIIGQLKNGDILMINIVVPMAGRGQRFLDKGISTPKPLIEVNSKPFISHVIDSVSFDDAGFSGGLTSFGVFNTSHFLGQFNGNTLACELGTGETEIFPQSRSLLTHVRPIIDTSSATGSISFRNRVSDTASNSGQTSMHSTGTIPFHRSARYFKINIQVPASTTWSDAQGLDIEAIKEGYR